MVWSRKRGEPETRVCSKCKEIKQTNNFELCKSGVRRVICILCYSQMSISPKDEIKREYSKAYRKRNPEMMKKARSRWKEKNPIRAHVVQLRNRAKKRFKWSLHQLLTEDLVTDNCIYCKNKPNPFNTIDRVDSEKGYHEGNVVSSCRVCNAAKSNMSVKEFSLWVKNISNNYNNWYNFQERGLNA